MSDNDGVLLEDIDHKLTAILEGVAPLATVPRQISEIDSRLRSVESDVKVIKAVLTDHSGELRTLDGRVAKLEQATS